MYSAVPPPERDPSVIEKDETKEKESPPRGISQETWEVFLEICLPYKFKLIIS